MQPAFTATNEATMHNGPYTTVVGNVGIAGGAAYSGNEAKRVGRFQLITADIEGTQKQAADVLGLVRAIAERICGAQPEPGNASMDGPRPPQNGILESYTIGLGEISSDLTRARAQLQRIADDIGL